MIVFLIYYCLLKISFYICFFKSKIKLVNYVSIFRIFLISLEQIKCNYLDYFSSINFLYKLLWFRNSLLELRCVYKNTCLFFRQFVKPFAYS